MVEWCSRQGVSHACPDDIIVSFVPLFLSKQLTTSVSPHPKEILLYVCTYMYMYMLFLGTCTLFAFWVHARHTCVLQYVVVNAGESASTHVVD